jgi:hypothetical protein
VTMKNGVFWVVTPCCSWALEPHGITTQKTPFFISLPSLGQGDLSDTPTSWADLSRLESCISKISHHSPLHNIKGSTLKCSYKMELNVHFTTCEGNKTWTKEQVNNTTECKPAPNTESKHFNTKWMATWKHCEANSGKSKRGGNHYIKELHVLFGLYSYVKTGNYYIQTIHFRETSNY